MEAGVRVSDGATEKIGVYGRKLVRESVYEYVAFVFEWEDDGGVRGKKEDFLWSLEVDMVPDESSSS